MALGKRHRVKRIQQLFNEMATGHYDFQLLPTNAVDEVEALTPVLNDMVQQVGTVIKHLKPADLPLLYSKVLQPILIVEEGERIYTFSNWFARDLGYGATEFKALDFKQLLGPASYYFYRELLAEWVETPDVPLPIMLLFIDASQQPVSYYCELIRMYNGTVVINSVIRELVSSTDAFLSEAPSSDAAKIQAVYDFIINHLDEPLPTTTDFSKQFEINEFKLKLEFRRCFNTSIYQLYSDERLKRARNLIVTTTLPLNQIAVASGFVNYMAFYKAFRKKYGCSPTEVSRI